jgi:hypothetical protein
MEDTVLDSPKAKETPRPRSAAAMPTWEKSLRQLLTPLASLRLTVVLLALSIILVFCGTLAQVDAGILTIVHEYFRTALVWVPLQIFFPRDMHVGGAFPFPGGWLIGGFLLANLLSAHAVRFRLSWKRSGVLLLHAGLVVMMLSELVTGLFAVEGHMIIPQGGSSNFIERVDKIELAVVDRTDAATDDVVTIPTNLLREKKTVESEFLPFDIHLVRYLVNSGFPKKPEGAVDNPATAGDGVELVPAERPEGNAVDPEQKIDYPSAYIKLTAKDSKRDLGTYLVSLWFAQMDRPQRVECDGKSYDLYLRLKRDYKPYTIHLLEFRHDRYVGTDTPRNFSSLVRLEDPTNGEDRKVKIYMNNPLRYQGETFYQSAVLGKDQGTILQVVRNVGWEMPYLSCGMVALGMLIHFGQNLFSFLQRRAVR